MAAIKLEARTVANLKPRSDAFYVTDAVVTGLQVRVAPDATKSWSVRYRFGGKQRRYGLGDFPTVKLADARAAANHALTLVASVPPVDPAALKAAAVLAVEQEKAAAELAKRDSMEAMCQSYIEYMKPRKRSWRDDQSKITCEILPAWKGRPVTSITRRDCRDLIKSINGRGASIFANRVVALLSRLFRFAMDEEFITANPAHRLPKPGVEASKRPSGEREPKAYSAEEVRSIWQSTEALSPPLRALYRLGLLTGQRPTEISGMEWREITDSWWTIPGARTKNNQEHRVYLVPAALELLGAVPRVENESRVFAGVRGKRQLAAINAIVFAGVRRREKPRHAFRDTVATGLAQSGVVVGDISKVLNHLVGSKVTAGYNAYSYDKERKAALTKWARTLRAIITEQKENANVVAFAARI